MDAGGRRPWRAVGVSPRWRQSGRSAARRDNAGHHSGAPPRGRPKQRPAKLVADRGYDSAAFRQGLRRRGMAMCIPPKRRPASWRAKRGRPVLARKDDYRRRYTVERTFAWLGTYRRLLIRWERLFMVYRAWFAVALFRVCLRRWARLTA